MTATLRIADSGWSSTIQDLGRQGFQRLGIGVSGALDSVSLQAANLLVGNAPNTGAIEAAYIGPTLVSECESIRMAVVGAEARLEHLPYSAANRGTPLAPNESFTLARGEALRIGKLKGASVLYIAVEGGFDVPVVLGSHATDVRGGFGGWNGQNLKADDHLPLRRDRASDRRERRLERLPRLVRERIRVVLGPQNDYFSEEEISRFLSLTFTVAPETNRMGMRLNGATIGHAKGFNIASDGVTYGSIQIMGNGQPLIMMADRPTTGGYPKIATVISADLPVLGRLTIGAPVAFEAISATQAQAERRAFLKELNEMLNSASEEGDPTPRNMLEFNLISGVVDALQ